MSNETLFNMNGVHITESQVLIEDITYELSEVISANTFIETSSSWANFFITMALGIIMFIINTHYLLSLFGLFTFIYSFFRIPTSKYYLNLVLSGNQLTLLYGEKESFIDEVSKAINDIKKSTLNKNSINQKVNDNVISQIEELSELLKREILTEEEFNNKKQKLLDKI